MYHAVNVVIMHFLCLASLHSCHWGPGVASQLWDLVSLLLMAVLAPFFLFFLLDRQLVAR
jgi:hypothetical protein